MNKTIKKIVALGLVLGMTGTTIAFATAYDLSDYPSPFVKNGVFDGKIVIGEKAAAIDTVGALDIAASLQRASSTVVSTSNGGDTSVSEGARLDTSSDRIYLGGHFGIDAVTSDQLSILADGQFEDDEGTTYDYTQAIEFTNQTALGFGQHDQSDVDSFLAFDMDTTVDTDTYTYVTKVDFTKSINATNTNVVGNKVTLFGNEYTFSSESDADKIVLYGSAKEVSLTTKDEVTQTVDGKEYKVKVIGFGDNAKVVVSVNGVSESITEGNSKTVNGLKVYAKSVSSWNNGLDGFATLQLGAQKIVLQDTKKVSVGTSETDLDGTYVSLGGDAQALTSIYIYINAPDSDNNYIKEGGSFKDPVYGTFTLQYVDNKYGLKDTGRDMITIRPSGSHKVYASVPVTGGSPVSVYFSYDGTLKWDQTRAIHPVEGQWVPQNDYMYLAPTDPRYTHMVKVTNINLDDSNGYVEFEDVLTKAKYKTKEGAFSATSNAALDLTVDGKTYKVALVDQSTSKPYITVIYGTADVAFPEILLPNGETFAVIGNVTLDPDVDASRMSDLVLPGSDKDGDLYDMSVENGTAATRTFTSDIGVVYKVTGTAGNVTKIESVTGAGMPSFVMKEEKADDSNWYSVLVPTTKDSNGVDVGSLVFSDTTATTGVSMENNDLNANLDIFGTYVTRYTPSGDNSVEVKISYPNDQMYANVFITPLAVTATTTTSTSGAVALNPIAVGLAILDSEATLGSKPYIVVGGPCANTVAATLMGNTANCADGFTEGKAKIKLFAAQNALLIAGYSGKDTQGASRVVADYKTYKAKFTGAELEVITTNLNSLSVNNVQ